MSNIYPYEKLSWLMKGKRRYILRMDGDEAKYLYDLVASLDNPYCVEIGRMEGGSVLLITYAGGRVFSLDLHISKTVAQGRGAHFDAYLKEVLNLVGLKDRAQIIVANSQKYDTSEFSNKVDILFIDGDHSYEGVKKDYENWVDTVKPSGHILFHDACRTRGGATLVPGVKKFVDTVPLKRINEIGSIVHFVKTKED